MFWLFRSTVARRGHVPVTPPLSPWMCRPLAVFGTRDAAPFVVPFTKSKLFSIWAGNPQLQEERDEGGVPQSSAQGLAMTGSV